MRFPHTSHHYKADIYMYALLAHRQYSASLMSENAVWLYFICIL